MSSNDAPHGAPDPEQDAITAVNRHLALAVGELTSEHEVVYEDREHIVYADHHGYELPELFDGLGIDEYDRAVVREPLQERARALAEDYDWSAAAPLVVDKPAWFREVEQHVLGRLADLIRESDSAARGVDRWATETMGLTYRKWGADHNTARDHGVIGKNVRRGRDAAENSES